MRGAPLLGCQFLSVWNEEYMNIKVPEMMAIALQLSYIYVEERKSQLPCS